MRQSYELQLIFSKSKRSVQCVKESITRFIESKLFLKVNRKKIVISYVRKVEFLEYPFYVMRRECLPSIHL